MEETKNTVAEEVEKEVEADSKVTEAKADKKKQKKADSELAALQKQLEKAKADLDECNDR